MTKGRKTKVGKFLQKVTQRLPDLVGDVIDVMVSPNPGGAIFGKLKDKLASELTGETGNALLTEANQLNALDFEAFELEEQSRLRASKMYDKSKDTTDEISKKIFKVNIPYVLILVLFVAFLNLGIILFVPNDMQATVLQGLVPVVAIVSSVVTSLLDERKQVTGFYLGSSLGSTKRGKK
ncbi:MAG: hypothetical protein AAF620_00090 [Bacteroidota bacterium]